MRAAAVSLVLAGSFATACAGTTELAGGEAEGKPTVVADAAVASPPPSHAAHTNPPNEPRSPAGSARVAGHREGAPPFDPRWADEVRSVVASYEAWGRVDDEARWAPWLCRIPRAATARVSESEHSDTHGHKLYTLYAMDPEAYGAPRSAMGGAEAVPGLSQVIVKESFEPVPLDDLNDAKLGRSASGGVGTHGLQPAERDGQRFVAGERKGLFIMMKTDAPTEGTDAGWVYATVEPDMITVTAVGVIDSCVGCHAEAGDDRLFGLPAAAGERADANAVPL